MPEWIGEVLRLIAMGVVGYMVASYRLGRRLDAQLAELMAASDERRAELDTFIVEMREKLREIARLAVGVSDECPAVEDLAGIYPEENEP